MGKDKLRKFAENKTFRCLVQPEFDEIFGKDHPLKGRWHADFFGNDRPIVLELGCGKGEYTVALAADDPTRNYIGVDIKGARMWRGAKTATEQGMANVGFLRTRIEFIASFFAPGEVDLIYLNFCDPWPRKKNAKRRLTFHTFLKSYQRVLRLNGEIHFKTDNAPLFEWSLGEFEACGLEIRNLTRNLHENGPVGIMTGYEEKFYALGTPINRCELINHGVLPDPEPAEKDEQTGIL